MSYHPTSPGIAATWWWPASMSTTEHGNLSDVVTVVYDDLPNDGTQRRRLLCMNPVCGVHLATQGLLRRFREGGKFINKGREEADGLRPFFLADR